jgi:ubiquinone/menaquinone biosynthesis C-methylase UbiE
MMSVHVSHESAEFEGAMLTSVRPLTTLHLGSEFVATEMFGTRRRRDLIETLVSGIKRRFKRERRRRKVGRAFDMALEIARVIPRGSEVLDVGCGNGFIAHHLSALLGAAVFGIDLEETTEAPIDYLRYDGKEFPAENNSFDAVLLCYVLHHTQEVGVMFEEIHRVLRSGGRAIIYEDIPATWWDRFVCSIHNKQWKDRTGACTFRDESEWRRLFEDFGFEVSSERQLSRLRNLTHPVRRRFYVLRVSVASAGSNRKKSSAYHARQSSM